MEKEKPSALVVRKSSTALMIFCIYFYVCEIGERPIPSPPPAKHPVSIPASQVGRSVSMLRPWTYISPSLAVWLLTLLIPPPPPSQVDVKCKELGSGGYYYPDHLPVLGELVKRYHGQPSGPLPSLPSIKDTVLYFAQLTIITLPTHNYS